VVPSLWPEPFALIGLEAAALGIPSVAFDVGGIRQWLDSGRSGQLVDPASGSQGLGAAMAALLADPALVSRLGAQARAIASRMSRAAHVDGLEAVLSGAVRRGAPLAVSRPGAGRLEALGGPAR
jgi:glycosyltransferase involved in cell wall biosynthesis